MNCNKHFAVAILATSLVAIFAIPSALAFRTQQQQPQPPPGQITVDGSSWKCNRTLSYVDSECFLRVAIAADTLEKKIHFNYSPKAGDGMRHPGVNAVESVSFWPTALCRSRTDPRGFHVAGRSATTAVLELWHFNNDEVLQPGLETPPGRYVTDFERPTITRTSLPVASTLGWPCDMTAVAPCSVPGANEEVWVMEWESRNVHGIAPTTGTTTVRIAASVVGLYRSMESRTHSIFGSVLILRRRPWQTRPSNWQHLVHADPTIDPDLLVLHDTNLDGSMEFTETITTAARATRALYATGAFTDNEQ